jgi:hypothetical protein
MPQAIGDVFWSLPARTYYVPGTELFCLISVANLDGVDRRFMLLLRSYRGAQVITEEALPVNGMAWFEVPAGDRLTVDGTIVLGESDVLLELSLVEEDTQQVVDRAYAGLEMS